MSLVYVILIATLLFVTLRFYVVPRIDAWAKSDLSKRGAIKTAISAAAQYLAFLFMLIFSILGFAYLSISTLTWIEPQSVSGSEALLNDTLIPLREFLDVISEYWGYALTLFLAIFLFFVCGCAGYSWRLLRHLAIRERYLTLLARHYSTNILQEPNLSAYIAETKEKLQLAEDAFASVVRSGNEDVKQERRDALLTLSERLAALVYINENLDIAKANNIQYVPAASPCGRLGEILLSRGLLNVLVGGKLWVFAAVTSLLILTTLMIPTTVFVNQLDRRIVELELLKGTFSLNNVMSDDEFGETDNAVDDTTIEEFAFTVEALLLGTPFTVDNVFVREDRTRTEWRYYQAKKAILSAVRAHRSQRANPQRKLYRPRTAFGHQLKQTAQKIAHKNPRYWNSVVVPKLRAFHDSFFEVADPRTVMGAVAGDALDFGTTAISAETIAGRVVRDMAGGTLSSFTEIIYSHLTSSLFTKIKKAKDLPDAVDQVARAPIPWSARETASKITNALSSLGTGSALEVLLMYPPSFDWSEERAIDRTEAATIARKFLSEVKQSGYKPLFGQSTVLDGMSVYDDYFPGRLFDDYRSARSRLVRQVFSKSPLTPPSSGSVFRSGRSFDRLTGRARLGGVLIGREPNAGEGKLDFVDVGWSWDDQDKQLILRFVDSTGRVVNFPPTASATVNLALAYVADGRPVAVTMINGSPFDRVWRVLLHPTLKDTNLGCAAIRLDQIVDGIDDKNFKQRRRLEVSKIEKEIELYEFAWGARFISLQSELKVSAAMGKRSDLFEQLGDMAKQAAERTPKFNELDGDYGRNTVISERPDFFDRRLVAHISSCLSSNQINDKLAECIRVESRKDMLQYKRDGLKWAAPPPGYRIISGVRERAYGMDSDLWLGSNEDWSKTDPLAFGIQVLFSTRPWLRDSQMPWFTEGYAVQVDKENVLPWNLRVGDQVAHTLTSKDGLTGEQKVVYEEMSKFTILQRVFKMALQGSLGARLPVEKLVDLAKDTALKESEYRPTNRWLPQTGGQFSQLFSEFRRMPADRWDIASTQTQAESLRNAIGVNFLKDQCRFIAQ